ncbi:MAG: sulfatase [Verrucomicrobiae bacterium]|nr:sulfatase [Verrucomicrobiae bacterium]NNJ43584.1 sulfatase [Akkermansiaceae bacterium]
MKKLIYLSIIGFLCYATSLVATAETNALADKSRPNIVFFISDDMSQEDFGCYGNPVIQTAHIDALANQGIRFDNAYLTTSSCSPSRCSIITGRYPHNTGAPELHSQLPDTQIRFPELLRQAGYYTVLSGKNHMFDDFEDRAFDAMTSGGGASGSEDWLGLVRNRPKDKPFFFFFASYDGHRSWHIDDKAPIYDPDDIIVPPYLVDTPAVREDLAKYYHEVSRYDYYIGQITEELKRQGVLDNTLIVVATDNGRPFPRDKTYLYDSGIKTPWVVHYPAMIKTPAVTGSLISVIDLSATCLELAGVNIPASIQGQSFVPILKDPSATTRDVVFAEHNWHVYQSHERMVRFGDYLYIKNNYPHIPNLGHESDQSYVSGKELWSAHVAGETLPHQQQIFANPCPAEQLFQMSRDPYQLRNLANHPAYASSLHHARQLLAQWTEQTGDTIPKNPTPDRRDPPRIVDGKIIPMSAKHGAQNPHAEFPGTAKMAAKINHPGPIRLSPMSDPSKDGGAPPDSS